MKYCPQCGTTVEEGRFCPACGSPLSDWPPAEQQPIEQQPNEQQPFDQQQACTPQPYEQQPAYPEQPSAYYPYSGPYGGSPLRGENSNSAIEIVRRLAGSPLYLIATIAYTLAIVLSIVASVTMIRIIPQIISQLYTWLITETEYYIPDFDQIFQAVTQSTGSSIYGSIVSMLPAFLLALGMWLFFGSAKNRSKPMSVGGLTVIKVICVITLVFVIISAVLVILVLLAGLAFSGALTQMLYEELGSDAMPIISMIQPILLVFLIVSVAVFVVAILYYAKLLKTVNTVRVTVRSGVPSDKVSVFVAVICFIGAIGSLSSIILCFALGMFWFALSTLCQAVAEFCFGLLIFKYRGAMRALLGPQQPVYYQ